MVPALRPQNRGAQVAAGAEAARRLQAAARTLHAARNAMFPGVREDAAQLLCHPADGGGAGREQEGWARVRGVGPQAGRGLIRQHSTLERVRTQKALNSRGQRVPGLGPTGEGWGCGLGVASGEWKC